MTNPSETGRSLPPATGWRAAAPNAITTARLGLAVAFVVVLSLPAVKPGATAWLLSAAGIFVVAALSDALDGYLARRWNAVSKFGRVMDPFADKVLVLSAFVLLAGPAFIVIDDGVRTPASGVYPWMVAVILARELLVTSLRGLLESQGRDASAQIAGKAKMVLQSVAIPLVLVSVAFDPAGARAGWMTAVNLVVVLVTAISAAPYLQAAFGAAPPNTPEQEP
ncbi:MAG: CDP-alcohol phosphatidyltransferase family protein [Planctomycetota bacterium]